MGTCVTRVNVHSATKDDKGGPLIRPIIANYALDGNKCRVKLL